MVPTVEQIKAHTRDRLNDVFRSGGESFTNDRLHLAWERAWGLLTASMSDEQISLVERMAYLPLPAYTGQITPASFGIHDVGEIQTLEEREAPSMVSISGASSTSPIQITVNTAGLSTNNAVIVFSVIGQSGANGRFFLRVDGPTTATLRGSVSQGAYISGGYLCRDEGNFTEVHERSELPQRDPQDLLRTFTRDSGYLSFVGATRDIQLRLNYLSTMAAPLTGPAVIDNSLNFLTAQTASNLCIATGEKRYYQRGVDYAAEAAGHLECLLTSMVRERQRVPTQRRMFGERWDTTGSGGLAVPIINVVSSGGAESPGGGSTTILTALASWVSASTWAVSVLDFTAIDAVFRNGLAQVPGVDVSITANEVTFLEGADQSDIVMVYYH